MSDSTANTSKQHDLPGREEELKVCHPAMFGNSPAYFVGLWLLMILGGAGLIGGMASANVLIGIFGLLILLGGMGAYFVWWIKVKFQVLTITEKRTIFRQGILTKRTTEVQHDDVRNIQVDQSMMQRIFNVGNLAISSSGQDDMEIVVKGIGSPDDLVEIIRRYQ